MQSESQNQARTDRRNILICTDRRASRTLNPEDIMGLADNMAAAAASFNSHGYDAFIGAREQLKQKLKRSDSI